MKRQGRSIAHRLAPLPAIVLLVAGLAACGGGSGGGGGAPAVTMSVQPASVVLGQSVTLAWSSSSGTTCSAGGAWSGAQAASGSASVTPGATGSVAYSITCSGGGYTDTATQTASVTVAPASAYSATRLVADTDTTPPSTKDTNLVNGWGIAFGPTSPVWVSNNHSNTSTLYDGNGKPQPAASPRIVKLPGGPGGAGFAPTGIVFNGTTDFVVSAAGKSASATFLFDGEGGMIAGWAAAVDATNAIAVYTDTGGAIYKGLAIASDGGTNYLYAADFHNGKVDVFDGAFRKQATTASRFAFKDPALPAGYAPFGIQAVRIGTATRIVVAYAKQAAPANEDETDGPGLGVVDVFDTAGALVTRLVSPGGTLNAPWGIALAPADFGTLSNALLVGNFGDGRINGFDPATGAFMGTVSDASGKPIVLPGLWGIAFGNDAINQPHATLFYAAGPNGEANGAYGRIDLGATPPVLGTPPAVTVTAPTGSASGTVSVAASVVDTVAVTRVEFFVNGTSIGVASAAPYSVAWDTTKLADGPATLVARATDANRGVGTSASVTVTVANAPPAVKLSQLQAQVFTPRCTGCHDGSQPANGFLPGSQDLRDGKAFASLVNVTSQEQPGVVRVKPGDPAASYLIRKLEGTAGITGQRMPLGGPFLDAATIDQVRSWIASGAPNN